MGVSNMNALKLSLALLAISVLAAVSSAQEPEEVVVDEQAAETAASSAAISLEKSVYFIDTNGAPIEIVAGDYVVDAAYGTLVLFDGDGIARAIQARWDAHDLELDYPIAVSLAGDTEAESDYHYIAVLMPGGSGLEAGGTYSGVRPRGLLDAAKNRVQKAANRVQTARKKVKKVRTEVQETVQQTAQQAGSAVQGAVSNVVQNVAGALPTAELQALIQAANQLGLGKLMVCLHNARGQRGQDIVGMISQLQSNPVSLVQNMERGIRQDVMSTFEQVAAPGLQLIRTGKVPTAGQVIGASFKSLNAIAQKGPMAKCVFDFAQPWVPLMQRGADQAIQQAQAETEKLFNQTVKPILEKAIVTGLQPVIAKATEPLGMSKAEEQTVAMGVYARSMTYQFGIAAGEVRVAIDNGNPAAIRNAIKKSEQWTEKAALGFAFEMIRVRGRRALDEHITTKVTAAIGTLSLSKDTIGSIVETVCGLIPEAGGGACALIRYPIKVAWNVIGITVLQKLAEQGIERSYEAYMACEANRLGIAISNEEYLPKMGFLNAGTYEKIDVRKAGICSIPNPWSRLFENRALFDRAVQETIEESLPTGMQGAISEYNGAMIALVDRWERDRRR